MGIGFQAGAIEDENAAAQQLADYERALWESGGADQAALQNYLAMIGAIGGMGGQGNVQEPYTPVKNAFGMLLEGLGATGRLLTGVGAL